MLREGGKASLRAALLLLCASATAHADVRYVANNGFNLSGPGACPKTAPCRTISFAIFIAAPGDKIIVGPGRYGDLNGNGVLGEANEEVPTTGCGCMIAVTKAVSLTSSAGSAGTVFDARTAPVDKNVVILASGAEFGQPGKGFTVTSTGSGSHDGLVINAADVKVRGNQMLRDANNRSVVSGTGINVLPTASGVLVQGNQAAGWATAISAGGDSRVWRNQASLNGTAILASGNASVIGNVLAANSTAVSLSGAASATGNAVHGNVTQITTTSSGAIQRNNIFGALSISACGLRNNGVPGVIATGNFWGAATGPGAPPADKAGPGSGCDTASTVTTPFASTPFKVKASIKP